MNAFTAKESCGSNKTGKLAAKNDGVETRKPSSQIEVTDAELFWG